MQRKIEEALSKNSLLAPCIIACFVFLVFIFSLPNAFVLDDPSQVLNSQVVSFDIPHIFGGSSFGVQGTNKAVGQYYKPLMITSYAVIYKLFGASPAPFHLFQILVHASCAILVFFLFKKFFLKTLSLLLALIFALHPFNSEAVLYISDLQDPLFFLFGIGALLVATKKALRPLDVVFSVILLALSLLSKETGILFIVFIFLYRIFFIHTFPKKLGELAVTYGIFLAFFLPFRFAAVGIVPNLDKPYPIMRLTFIQRLITVPSEVLYYIRNFFFPYDFSIAQHWVVTSMNFQSFYLPVIIDLLFFTILIGFFILLIIKKSPLRGVYLFFILWFLSGMIIHLNFFPLDVTVADRWFYFPSVGLLGMLGAIIATFKFEHKKFFLVIIMMIILFCAVRTTVRVFDWRTGFSLATRDIQYSKHSFPLENNLGYELINAGRYDEAEVHILRSISYGPWWWLNWNNLGVIYRHKGFTKDPKYYKNAELDFRKAIQNGPTFYMPYENLGELVTYYDTPQNAQKFLIETSKKMPLSARLWSNLAVVQLQLKDQKGGLEAANQARLLAPNDPQIQALYQAILDNKTIQIQKPTY